MKYDIFISYRRKGSGAGVAGELQAKLENKGYKVFLDVDEIGSGQFPEQISHAIEECNDFILVLSPGSLDRCADSEDWVLREIEIAERLGKNIVGVALPGFVMPTPSSLPTSIQTLPTRQVFLWTHEYRNASFSKIEENLRSLKIKMKRNKKRMSIILSIVLVAAVVGIVFLTEKPRAVAEERRIDSESQKINQTFYSYVQKAQKMTNDLPDTNEYRRNCQQYIANGELYYRLMDGIATYDTALMMKKQYGEIIVDTVGVDLELKRLTEIRKCYLNVIVSDMEAMMEISGWDFAYDDWTIANVLAEPDERPLLDSLGMIIGSRKNT